MSISLIDKLKATCRASIDVIMRKNLEYGESWKQRGGVGAYMMLARKWDRLENQVKREGWDIFAAMNTDDREEGIIDDIRDLTNYLLLVQTEYKARVMSAESVVATPTQREFVSHGYQPEIDGD